MREDITMFDKRFFQQLVGTDDNQHTGAKVKAEDVPILLSPCLELLLGVL